LLGFVGYDDDDDKLHSKGEFLILIKSFCQSSSLFGNNMFIATI
jgi:hypothetical protein